MILQQYETPYPPKKTSQHPLILHFQNVPPMGFLPHNKIVDHVGKFKFMREKDTCKF